jgi:hypothetical protein
MKKFILLLTLLAMGANIYSQESQRTVQIYHDNTVRSMFLSDMDSIKNVYSQRIMHVYRGGDIVDSMQVSYVDSVTFGLAVRYFVIASGTTGSCVWTLASYKNINDCDYILIVNGSSAMENYSIRNRAPWYDYRECIKTVIIGDSVTAVGNYAFYDCYSLTSVTIPNSVTTIGKYAFIYCIGLTSVTIGNSVTSIGNYAFYDCYSLTSVIIPNSVTSIGDFAFYYCDSLTSVDIPNSVTFIGYAAFAACSKLTSINVDAANPVYSSTDGVVFNKVQDTLIVFPGGKTGSYTIPSSVTSIGNYAFYDFYSLTSVIIPNSVTSIGNFAFYYCDSLTSVDIPNSVTSIGNYAFAYCSSLTIVTNLNSTPQSISSNVFSGVTLSNATLRVPAAAVSAYEAASVWQDFGTKEGI